MLATMTLESVRCVWRGWGVAVYRTRDAKHDVINNLRVIGSWILHTMWHGSMTKARSVSILMIPK